MIGLFQDKAQFYVDASGDSLHRRGYRGRAGAAPLNETLAAGILKLARWDGSHPLFDPMCGSATFGIEAGLMLRNIAPGLLRKKYGFQEWPDFERGLYQDLIDEAKKAVRKDAFASITGLEIDPSVVTIARQNIDMAGLTGLVRVETGDFFKWSGPEILGGPAGTIVMNPPSTNGSLSTTWRSFGGLSARGLRKSTTGGPRTFFAETPLPPKPSGFKAPTIWTYTMEPSNAGSSSTISKRPRSLRSSKLPRRIPDGRRKPRFSQTDSEKLKHFSRWARREGITCWRVYDRDIPELPFLVDIYGDRMHFAEVQRNHDHSDVEHLSYMQLMVKTANGVTGIPGEKTYFKKRSGQSAAVPPTGEFFEVAENGHRFLVNLADHIDVGLFLDQRDIRVAIGTEASGKDFLDLYGYTGSLTVYAAAGGARPPPPSTARAAIWNGPKEIFS